MGYFLENWGSFLGVVSLGVTITGAIFSIAAFQRAGKARNAANSAETASQQTRLAIARGLTTVDLQRAIALVNRLKELHRYGRWEVSLEHYQPLRVMLEDIDSRHTETGATFREAIPQIKVMEDNVDRAFRDNTNPSGARRFNELLNSIQSDLENLASSFYSQARETEG